MTNNGRFIYTPIMETFLAKNSSLKSKELVLAFNQKFETKRTKRQLTAKLYNLGKGQGPKRLPPIQYSDAELDFISENRSLSQKELHKTFCNMFKRTDVTSTHIKRKRLRMGWTSGRTGYFDKGHTSWNKGKKIGSHPNSAKTQFKKGQIPPNAKPIGHERICSKDGYILILTACTNPYTGAPRWYQHKHRVEWIKAHGPIPKGFELKCWDGDKANTQPSNWFLITRAERAVLNRWHPEFDSLQTREEKEAVLAIMKLRRGLAAAKKRQKSAANSNSKIDQTKLREAS